MNEETIVKQIARARENRCLVQQQIIRTHGKPLISFTLNIPGPDKQKPLYDRIFKTGINQIKDLIRDRGWQLLYQFQDSNAAGNQGFFCINSFAEPLKQSMVMLEETHGLGRIFDIDVLDSAGRIISRRELGLDSRTCIVCGQNPLICRRTRAHTWQEVLAIIHSTAHAYFNSRQ